MPKFFCDYCDVYLTHDSMSVRKAHNTGRNHLRNVVEYYQQIGHEQAQKVIDTITQSYQAEGAAHENPFAQIQDTQSRYGDFPAFSVPDGMPPAPFRPTGLPPAATGMPGIMPGMPRGMPPLSSGGMPFPPFPAPQGFPSAGSPAASMPPFSLPGQPGGSVPGVPQNFQFPPALNGGMNATNVPPGFPPAPGHAYMPGPPGSGPSGPPGMPGYPGAR